MWSPNIIQGLEARRFREFIREEKSQLLEFLKRSWTDFEELGRVKLGRPQEAEGFRKTIVISLTPADLQRLQLIIRSLDIVGEVLHGTVQDLVNDKVAREGLGVKVGPVTVTNDSLSITIRPRTEWDF